MIRKSIEFPKAEVPPEERARRLKSEVDRLASLPAVEWLFYVESDGVAEKHGVSRAYSEGDDRDDYQSERRKKRAKTRLKIGSAYSASRRNRSKHAGERNGRAVSRSGPIKRLCVSKKKKIALSRRLSSCRAWNRRRDLLNWQSA